MLENNESKSKGYSDTLNLPKTEFPMRGSLPDKEPEILKDLETKEIYKKVMARNKQSGKQYLLHDGPPYANGDIHIGHAFNKTLKDIIVKYKNMSGCYSPYIPGWDTHGLPIEKKVEQVLNIKKDEVGIVAFRQVCKKYALEQVAKQSIQFKRLGVFGDFDNRYVTLDPEFEVDQINVFTDMYMKGFIYRDLKPVYWCEDCATALAEAEIEYQDDIANSIYVKFNVIDDKGVFNDQKDKDNIYFVIWTTTPWTMPGNQAVTANPDFEYSLVKVENESYMMATELVDTVMSEAGIEKYTTIGKYVGKDLENIILQHPMLPKTSRVILGSDNDLVVTLDAGTGLVHTAPGHGHEDYAACKRYKDIEIVVPVDEFGYMTAEAGELEGLKYSEATKRAVEILRENGALIAAKDIKHPYPHCWRCHKPIIYRATTQWFASVEKFRQDALDAIKTVKWFPAWGEERMVNMIKDRADWCISRQRVWGVPIPIFYCEDCGKEFLTRESIAKLNETFLKESTDAWYEKSPEELLSGVEFKCECGCTKLKKETDIMDVWFDSGSSHFAILKEKYGLSWPADLYLEGNDQYRGWFQSSLLTSVAVTGKSPYIENITHGFLTDGQGKKMSKSLGNGIDPLEIFNKFGADILRLWTVSSDYHTDVRVSMDIIMGVSEVYKKIRNTARFMLGNLFDFDADKGYVEYADRDVLDRYIMIKLNDVVKNVNTGYQNYDFHFVYNEIYKFCTSDLSSRYLDVVKDRLYTLKADNKLRKSIQSSMYDILKTLTVLLTPILSFTSEEIWSYMTLKTTDTQESVLLSPMPEYDETMVDAKLVKYLDKLYALREEILAEIEKARAEKIVGHPLDARVNITLGEKEYETFKDSKELLEMIVIVSQVTLAQGDKKIVVEKAAGTKCERCWKYSEEVGQDKTNETLCPKCIEEIK